MTLLKRGANTDSFRVINLNHLSDSISVHNKVMSMEYHNASRPLAVALSCFLVLFPYVAYCGPPKTENAQEALEKMVASYTALKTLRLEASAYKDNKMVSKSAITYVSPNLLRIETTRQNKKRVVVYNGEKIGVMDADGNLLKRFVANPDATLARSETFNTADARYVMLIFLLSGNEMTHALPETSRRIRFGATKTVGGIPVREIIIDINFEGDKSRIIYGIGRSDYLLRYCIFSSPQDKENLYKEVYSSVVGNSKITESAFMITPTYLPDALLPQE